MNRRFGVRCGPMNALQFLIATWKINFRNGSITF